MTRNSYWMQKQIEKNKVENRNYQETWTPNNFMKDKGVSLEDTLYPSEWMLPPGLTANRDTTEKLFESGSIMFTLPKTGWKGVTRLIDYDFTNVNVIAIAFYIEDRLSFNQVQIKLSTNASYNTNYNNWTTYFESKTVNTSSDSLHSGWNYIKFHKNDFTNVGAETWGNFKAIRLLFTMPATKYNVDYTASAIDNSSTVVGIGGIYLNPVYETPKLILNFDDSQKSMFVNMFPYMRKKGIKATLFLCRNHIADIDTTGSCMTPEQHDEWYNAGNDIGNHSTTHGNIWAMTEQEIEWEFKNCLEYLLSRGYTRAAYFIAFPQARYNALALKVIKNLGFKMARGRDGHLLDYITSDELLQFQTKEMKNTVTLADLTGYIDRAIALNSSISIFTHGVLAVPDSYNTTIEIFKSFIDYVVAKRDAGLIDVVTISEFYNKLTKKNITLRKS